MGSSPFGRIGRMSRSYTGAFSVSERAGTLAACSPAIRTSRSPPGSSVATTAVARPHFAQTARTRSSFEGWTIASIRSCDSDVRISNASMPSSRSGTRSRSSRAPSPARAADSLTAQVSPAPPRSWSPSNRSSSISSSEASIRSFSANGSPICTEGRDPSLPSSIVADASTETPPIPSRPVVAPYRTMKEPELGVCVAAVISRSALAMPTHSTFTVGFAECGGANRTSPPTVGTPMQLP